MPAIEAPPYHILTGEEREEIIRLVRAIDEAAGVDHNAPYISPEELKARMEKNGVRAQDNIFQRELMKIRYGNDEEAK